MLSFDQLLSRFRIYLKIDRAAAAATLSAYMSDVKSYGAYLASLKESPSLQNLNTYLQTLCPARRTTLWRKRSALLQFFRFLWEEGLVEADPSSKTYRPPRPENLPRALGREEMEDLLELARREAQEKRSVRRYAFILTLYKTAARVSEWRDLRMADLEQDRAMVRGKGDKARWVFLTPDSEEALQRYLQVRHRWAKPINPYLWGCDTRGRLTRQIVHKWLQDLGAKLGLQVSPHILRHTQATQLLPHMNILDLGTILGHSSINTTSRYLRVRPEELQKSVHKFHPLSILSNTDAEEK